MAKKRVVAKKPVNQRKPVDEPPSFERVVGSLRSAGRWYIGVGVVTLLCGLAILATGLFSATGEGAGQILNYGGTLVSGLSLVPFRQGWFRLERIGFLDTLRDRWVQLARAGDPNDQIATLSDIYTKLLRDSLGAAEPAVTG
jgi:hypothetical protein